MTRRGWAVGVVIPAQDEEERIAACIDSIIEAWRMSARAEALWIVVVADSCTDATASIARAHLADHGEVLEYLVHSPGSARRLGVAAVLSRFERVEPRHLWIANTDADSTVPQNWIEVHLREADEGASAVAGIVDLAPQDLRAEVAALYRDTYRVEPDGGHSHVHGANLGIRADAYLDSGGWSNATVAEDHCLWGRLQARGWHLRSTSRSVVTTSARLYGRAVGGFADRLRSETAKRAKASHG